MSEGQISTDIIYLVALREDLSAELTTDVSISCELSHQHTLVITTQSIHGRRWHDVPSTSNAVTNGEALT